MVCGVPGVVDSTWWSTVRVAWTLYIHTHTLTVLSLCSLTVLSLTAGGERGLESALQRLDFGPSEMKAEGVVGDCTINRLYY
jgi:hypothetical protein